MIYKIIKSMDFAIAYGLPLSLSSEEAAIIRGMIDESKIDDGRGDEQDEFENKFDTEER